MTRPQSGEPLHFLHMGLQLKAFHVAAELQEWINTIEMLDTTPIVNLVVSEVCLELSVGDDCVWSDSVHNEEELTFESCLDRYKETHDHTLKILADQAFGHPPDVQAAFNELLRLLDKEEE